MRLKTRRIFKWIGLTFGGILLATLFVFVLAFVDTLGYFHEPPLRLVQSGKVVTVHVETLGEYPSTVGHVRIAEDASGKVVFEMRAKKEFIGKMAAQLHYFQLAVGENSAKAIDPEGSIYNLVEPRGMDTFTLRPGIKYRLRIWGDSWTYSEKSFKF